VAIASPPEGAFRNSASLTVAGSVTDGLSGIDTVQCNGAPASVASGQFGCAITLAEGANPILVEASDRAGNSSSSMVTVALVAFRPQMPVTRGVN
jgi:hypothetical protein